MWQRTWWIKKKSSKVQENTTGWWDRGMERGRVREREKAEKGKRGRCTERNLRKARGDKNTTIAGNGESNGQQSTIRRMFL